MDTLELYRWAVQDPETHAEVLRLIYERLRPGRVPAILREDFAGTSAESVAWVALGPRGGNGRRAICVDLDAPTLEWAANRASRILGPASGSVQFVSADVMQVGPPQVPPADLISVLNFSMLYLRSKNELDNYLEHAHACLAPGGVLVMNTFGGSQAVSVGTTSHWVTPTPRLASESTPPPPAPFRYHWEVRAFDPKTAAMDCRIHFEVPSTNPSATTTHVRDAFRYDWRLWSITELLAACKRAGFSGVESWRHTYDPSLGAAGVFLGPVQPQSVADLPTWTAYIVAAK
jgi:SAM-dependent methyltransferase